MTKNKLSTTATRRKFLGGAAVAGVATIAMPQVSRAQTVTLKMQSGFGPTDILSDYGRDYVAKVNEMGGGRLKIDFLNSGAVVKPFSVMDATSSGVLDGNYSVPAYWYGKHRAASLFGTGPVYGTNADQYMGWFYYGGGDALYRELTQDILKLNVVGFFVVRHADAAARLVQEGGQRSGRLQGPEVSHRRSRLQRHAGDGRQRRPVAWTGNPAGDGKGRHRRVRVQQPDLGQPLRRAGRGQVLLPGLLPSGVGSHRSRLQQGQVRWLAKEQQQILRLAAQASSADSGWKAWDIYSKDLETLITKHDVQVKRTPESIFKAQLAAWDKVVTEISADSAQGPFIKKILESQKAWGKRVGFYAINNEADFKSAYEHYFGKMKV